MWEYILNGAIAGIIVVAGIYLTLRSHKLEEIVTNSIENLLEDVGNNESLQKNLYTVGALIGNGVKSGVGLQKRGGKMSITDLVIQALAGKFLGENEATESVKSNIGTSEV